MGLLMNLLTHIASQEKPDELTKLKEAKTRAELAKIMEDIRLGRMPTWTDIPTGAEYDPAAQGLFPGQRPMEVTGKYYRVPSDRPREKMVGPTIGEVSALKLPDILKTMIGEKASMPFMADIIKALRGPKTLEQMGTQPYLSGEEIKFQGYMKLLDALQKLEKPEEIREEEVKKPDEEMLPDSFTYTPGAKDLVNQLEIMMGLKEKEAQPKVTMGKPGEYPFVTTGPEAGKQLTRIPPEAKKPKLEAGFAAWKEEHPKGTYLQYKRDLKRIELMEAEPSIEDLSGEVRKWMNLEKSIAMGGLDNELLAGMMMMLPETDPMKQAFQAKDLSALQEMATRNREYYQERLTEAQIKKEYPNAKKDEQGNWVVTIDGKEYIITE